MNTKLEDFIFSCSEFNACNLKNSYSDEHEPSDYEVSANLLICKKYVLSSLKSLIYKNQ